MDALTLITPTSDRPQGIALAKRWMAAQRLNRPLAVNWLICDDGHEPADVTSPRLPDDSQLQLTIDHIRQPAGRPVPLSFRGNVCAGLCRVETERVAIWEDDDFYPPDWLQFLIDQFDAGAELIGQARAKYYHLPTRRYRIMKNHAHASLCQSAFVRRISDWLDHRCRTRGGTFIDLDLWKRWRVPGTQAFLADASTVIGIKGLPGKSGIGIGHRLGDGNRFDADGSILRSWCGDEAAAEYDRFRGDGMPSISADGYRSQCGRRAA